LSQLKNGKLTMTLTVADNRELVGWILSFGSRVRVIEPASLRKPSVRKPRLSLTNRKTSQADSWKYHRKENAARDI
jgi:predicted DNA-binding transcriptional regulator YafY